ncbi:pumilio homolog 12-like [Henckelia pumila]|uniref:pumilio homolog 12-like n=1 Tax=Henckelia pumila TaxID=405737 RepID=UPI003C6E529F
MLDDNTLPLVPAGDRRKDPQPYAYFLEELKGKLFWEAMDTNCSQFLYLVLERRKPEVTQMIFSEVKDQICILMSDRCGSNVVEKLYEVCNEQQMDQLVFSITANVDLLMAVCLHSRGSKSMKKFLQCLVTPDQISHMISIFLGITVPLVNHEIGVGVIRHCLHIFPAKQTQILDVIADNLFEIATWKTGCLLLGDVLGSKVYPLESQQRIVSEIIANVHRLCVTRYGCHVARDVLCFKIQDGVRDIVARLTGTFASLSMNTHASDLVLSLIEKYKEECAPQIINEIICSSDFSRLLLHPDGKDVLEHAKKYSKGAVLKSLNHQIALHSDHSRSPRHGENNPPKSQGTVHKIMNHQVPLHSDQVHSHCHGKNIMPKSQGTGQQILNQQIPDTLTIGLQ